MPDSAIPESISNKVFGWIFVGNRPWMLVWLTRSHILPVVRRLAGDRDVVDVAFAEAGAGDADELAVLLHLGDGAVAGVAHRGFEAADQLMDDVADRALVRHPALDPFGHQLQR